MPIANTSLQHLYRFSRKHFLPTNDLYGAIYQDMDQTIHAFEKRVHTLNIEFHFACQPPAELPSFLHDYKLFTQKDGCFDRIDVTHLPIQGGENIARKYL